MSERAYVARLTRGSRSNFYYSFLFLPRPQREAIHAVYAFCRMVDDSVDQSPGPEEAARRMTFWRSELAACAERAAGGPAAPAGPTHPVTRRLSDLMARYPIPRRHLEEVLDGVAMDVAPRRYRTFVDLRGYCYRVASAVGLVCIEIFGYRDPSARDYAVQLGLAFQITNILRDLRSDAERGRVYLPLEEMQAFRCPESDLTAERPSPRFRELMRFQASRARGLFAEAHRLFPAADRRTLVAAEIMAGIYEALLDRIEKLDYDVLRRRVTLSPARKLAIATRLYLRSRAAAPAA